MPLDIVHTCRSWTSTTPSSCLSVTVISLTSRSDGAPSSNIWVLLLTRVSTSCHQACYQKGNKRIHYGDASVKSNKAGNDNRYGGYCVVDNMDECTVNVDTPAGVVL